MMIDSHDCVRTEDDLAWERARHLTATLVEALEAALVCLEDPTCGRLKALNLVKAALAKAASTAP